MNVDDIIQKLQCCGNQMYSCTDKRCKAKTLGDAVDLINFLRAEIERLNHIRAEQSKEISALREEIDSLKRFEAMRLEAEELFCEQEEMFAQSDKERQEAEAFEKLMQIAEMTEERTDGNL